MTGNDELEDGREQLLVVEPFLAVASRDQRAHEVVAGGIVLGLDEPAQLQHDRVRRVLGPRVVGRRRCGYQHGHQPATERGALVFGYAEQLADHREREREGERVDQIGRRVGVPVGQRVEEVVDDGLHTRPQVFDPAHRERGRHQTTQPGVVGRVDGKHVPSELGAREALGHDPAVHCERGAHVLREARVVERRAGLVVTDHEPRVVTVGQRDVVHRAERAHFGEEREGVVAVVGPPRVERGLYLRARLIACRERIDGAIGHGRTPSTECATTRSCRSRS